LRIERTSQTGLLLFIQQRPQRFVTGVGRDNGFEIGVRRRTLMFKLYLCCALGKVRVFSGQRQRATIKARRWQP
jgi:hypothetical protein